MGTEAEAREVTLVNPARDRMWASFLHSPILFFLLGTQFSEKYVLDAVNF